MGVIYINKNLSPTLVTSIRDAFCKDDIKMVLIDNAQVPKHTDLMDLFDEVTFFDRFKKNKIVDCGGFYKDNDGVQTILMDDE